MNIYLSDLLENQYFRSAENRIRNAFRPGTTKNHLYILTRFVAVAIRFGCDYRAPSYLLWVLYIEYLARTQKTASAVASTISSLKAILQRLQIPVQEIHNYFVASLQRSISINKRTVTFQRPPITPAHIRNIFNAVKSLPNYVQFKAAVLLMFVTNMRQSNLFPRTRSLFDPQRMLTRSDVNITPNAVVIRCKWSKSQQTVSNLRYQTIPRAKASGLCLRAALIDVFALFPQRAKSQPLFQFRNRSPITSQYMVKRWKQALRYTSMSPDYTLHSLRRGGALYLQRAGVPLPDLASHGGWKSAAVLRYARHPSATSTANALRELS